MDIFYFIQGIGQLIDFVGVLIFAVGMFLATVVFLKQWYSEASLEKPYKAFRYNLARVILLGLEFLVAGDIIRSVTGTPSLMSVAILAIIVLIRSFLSITFEMEVEGRWPWEKKKTN